MPSSYADMNNEQLRLNAQEGDVEAAFLLGKRLLAVRGSAMEGVEYLKEAAKKRHLQACEILGSTFLYGEGGVPQDKRQAMVYYEQAQALGSVTARTRLIDLYLDSEDKAERGLQLLTDAADAGDRKAAARAARLYLTGEVSGVDLERAAKYALISDDSAVLFETAEKLDLLDTNEALRDEMYQKLLAKDREGAQLGISACLALGELYRRGKGTKADGRSAERLFLRAVELEKQQVMSEPKAELMLAELYEKGAEGLPADHESARRLLRSAYKSGNELARVRYIELCTADGDFEKGYQAYAEARQYGDALHYVLTNWEKIPDKARFVERAFPFAPLSQKENPDLRSLRDELYRRMQMAGKSADQVLAHALKENDMTGALTYFEGLDDAGRSAVYGNRGLRASIPAPQPGENPALTRLRALLAEVPEEIRRWDAALAQWNGCITPQQKWDYAQKTLPTLPEKREGEASSLTALRRALTGVPKPAAPKPDDGVDAAALRARWQEKSSNRYSLEDRIFFLMELLDQLPAQKAGERQELTDLRSEMNSRLESYWKGLHHRLTQESTEDADRRVMAKVIQERICSKAQPFIAAHPSAEFSALCGTISGILDTPPMPQPEQPPVQKEPAAQSTEDALHLEWQMAKKRGGYSEEDFLLDTLEKGIGSSEIQEEMFHALEEKWEPFRKLLEQQTSEGERGRYARMIDRRFPKERVRRACKGRKTPSYNALRSMVEATYTRDGFSFWDDTIRCVKAEQPRPEQTTVKREPSEEEVLRAEWKDAKKRGNFAEIEFLIRALEKNVKNNLLFEELFSALEEKWKDLRVALEKSDEEGRRWRIPLINRCFPEKRVRGAYAGRPSPAYDALCSAMEAETTARQQEKPKPAPQAPKTISPEAIRREWKRVEAQDDPDKATEYLIRALNSLPKPSRSDSGALTGLRGDFLRELDKYMEGYALALRQDEDHPEMQLKEAGDLNGLLRRVAPLFGTMNYKGYAHLKDEVRRVLERVEDDEVTQRKSGAEKHSTIDWETMLEEFQPQSYPPEKLGELMQLFAEQIPFEKTGEDPKLHQYRLAVARRILELTRQLSGELVACNNVMEQRAWAQKRRDCVLFPAQEKYMPPELRQLRTLTSQLLDAPRETQSEWQKRLNAFNQIRDEEKKREFVRGPMGQLPDKTADEPAELTILRTLMTPYRVNPVTQEPPKAKPQPKPQQRVTPQPPKQEKKPQQPPKPKEKPKKKGGCLRAFLIALAVMTAISLLGTIIQKWEQKKPFTTSKPSETEAPATIEPTVLPANAVALTELEPVEKPSWFYTGKWGSKSYQNDFVVLDGDSTRTVDGIGMYVLTAQAQNGEGEVSVRYQLDGEYSRLTFLLSPDQKWGCSPDHGTYQLSVLCDGAEVYHSDWLDYAQNDWVEADMSGCETLEIVLRERPGVKGTLNIVLAEPELV